MIANVCLSVCLSASKVISYEWILKLFSGHVDPGLVTWDLNSVDCGLFDAVQECKNVGHLCCRHVLSFPSVKKNSLNLPAAG